VKSNKTLLINKNKGRVRKLYQALLEAR